MEQAIPLPKSSSSIVYEQLGYIDSFDAVVDKLYAFLIYKETRTSNNKWVVRIKGSVTAGTVFDPDNRSLESAIQKAQAHSEEYLVWGFNLVPKGDDPRLVENRIFYNDKGEFSKFEIHLITRDKDGNGLPEKVASIDWPVASSSEAGASEAPLKQAIPLPKSSSSIIYEQLGYINSFDAVVDKLYAFLIYKETRTSNNKWVVRIKGSVTAGTVFDPDNRSLESAIQKAQAHGEEYLVWGFNLVPKGDDPRLVENRIFYNDNGGFSKFEVHLITRDKDGNGLPEKAISIDWPGATNGGVDDDFMAFFAKYEQACRDKDSSFLKSILPEGIPEDEFNFVIHMSYESTLAIDATGVKPVFNQTGNRMDVTYEGDLGDGMTSLVLDFYHHNDQWLKYDPTE
ncbi:hypothetical protein ACFLQX_00150 [Bacteroidota bacterium]